MADYPTHILFSQHGLTDTNQTMRALAQRLAGVQMHVVAPNLGYVRTLWHMQPLLNTIEQAAQDAFRRYPDPPVRIVATSLGGVLWVELLSQHPEWWPRIESLVLLGAPIGGSDFARMVDPFGWGIGIAKHLGQNRRDLAEAIAATIPTLVVAGHTSGGRDGTVPIEATKLNHAHFVCLEGVTHPQLRHHPKVVQTIQDFWAQPRSPLPLVTSRIMQLIDQFRRVPGMTDTSTRYFAQATPVCTFVDGITLRTWRNPMGVDYLFIANAHGQCTYAGFVGWMHAAELRQALRQVQAS
ncbi:lysophospholipase [Leptolyngbya sp. CCY15150]|uniref:alpha/beta fold hydrolase n=1 Tax=Leptolyngbya sp. CCY15150 TaxID=2767772 RepID=UPI0019516CAF|nr:lysophospholipase [Leptolyngbya sp. CCY15150]